MRNSEPGFVRRARISCNALETLGRWFSLNAVFFSLISVKSTKVKALFCEHVKDFHLLISTEGLLRSLENSKEHVFDVLILYLIPVTFFAKDFYFKSVF